MEQSRQPSNCLPLQVVMGERQISSVVLVLGVSVLNSLLRCDSYSSPVRKPEHVVWLDSRHEKRKWWERTWESNWYIEHLYFILFCSSYTFVSKSGHQILTHIKSLIHKSTRSPLISYVWKITMMHCECCMSFYDIREKFMKAEQVGHFSRRWVLPLSSPGSHLAEILSENWVFWERWQFLLPERETRQDR